MAHLETEPDLPTDLGRRLSSIGRGGREAGEINSYICICQKYAILLSDLLPVSFSLTKTTKRQEQRLS